jgi:hypothetical protein
MNDMGIAKIVPCPEMCIVCHSEKREGIHLLASFICRECEQHIVEAETDDPSYQYYVEQLRELKKKKATS